MTAVRASCCCALSPSRATRSHSSRSRRVVARRPRHRARPRRGARRAVDRGPRHDRDDRHARGRAAISRALSGRRCRFRVPGGDLGRFRSIVVGAPEFAVDRARRRLPRRVRAQRPVRARAQPGRLPHRPRRRRRRRVRDLAGDAGGEPRGAVRIVRGDPSRRALPLNDFEQRVRELAGG